MIRFIRVLLIAAAFSASSAQAIPVEWTLNTVQFDDGGTATGSFVYDADTDTYTDFSIQTFWVDPSRSAGFWDNGLTAIQSATPTELIVANYFLDSFQELFEELTLNYSGALTNSGGTYSLSGSERFTHIYDDPDLGIVQDAGDRLIVSGTVSTNVIPIPAAVWLFSSGLGLLGFLKRKGQS
ncbi:MAG: hypothetical protein ACR2P6_06910 [Gammaproteobacteria bacterium]